MMGDDRVSPFAGNKKGSVENVVCVKKRTGCGGSCVFGERMCWVEIPIRCFVPAPLPRDLSLSTFRARFRGFQRKNCETSLSTFLRFSFFAWLDFFFFFKKEKKSMLREREKKETVGKNRKRGLQPVESPAELKHLTPAEEKKAKAIFSVTASELEPLWKDRPG